MTEKWEPNYGFTKTDRKVLASALEAVRRRVCAYGPKARTCDCKFGLGATLIEQDKHVSSNSEETGCPELRSMIRLLLHGDDEEVFAEIRRDDWAAISSMRFAGPLSANVRASAPSALTVEELRRLLNTLPPTMDEYVVVQASDADGATVDPFGELAVGFFSKAGGFRGAVRDSDECWSDAMGAAQRSPVMDDDVPAVCLWPR